MARLFRIVLRIFTGIAVLCGLTLGFVYYFASRSLPDYDAERSVAGITGPVEILRDNANVPHIFATTDADVFFGLGFAHAQDRLWQMTMLRRTVQGRLSEMFGARTIRTDELMRRLDLAGAAAASEAAQDVATRAALRAYAAGVNAWIQVVNEEALGRGAPEFFMFSRALAPWQPADSIAVQKLMALILTNQAQEEVLRARTALVLPPERLTDLLPDAPGTAAGSGAGEAGVPLPDFGAVFDTLPRSASAPTPPPPLSPLAPSRQLAGASNAWAASSDRSAAGGTLVAGDPHLGLAAPSVWYLARLELSTGGVIGGTIPGIPTILAGRSERLGWAPTAAYIDDQDIFIEELNPGKSTEYRTPEGWREFRTARSIIDVHDAEPVTITLRWTENGPVLPGRHFDLGTVTPPGHVAALAWTALSRTDTTLSGALALMQAQSVADAIAAGPRFVAPGLNLVLADTTSIALQTLGAVPDRDPAHRSQGRLPALGWMSENRWTGLRPYTDNPRFIDPARGVLGNTNNRTVDRPFPNHVSFNWGDTQRIQRWRRLMAEREVHTRESFIAAQLDTVSVTARGLLPLVARDLWFTGEAAPEGTPVRLRQRALALLANWNGEMNEHLPEPLIYAAWMRRLQDKLIRDDLGPLADAYRHIEPLFIERVYRNIGGAAAWCDIRQSTITESCTDIARIALDEALLAIGADYGTALESLRWGDAHMARHHHQVLGDIPLLKWFVNIDQSTSGGDNTLLRGATRGHGPRPYDNIHGAGYRGVYDFADPDSSVFIISTGQSGHPLSRHYDDLGELWRRGEYIPMTLDIDLARAGSIGTTRLTPRP